MFSRLLANSGRRLISKNSPLCLRVINAQRYSNAAVVTQATNKVAVANAYPAQLKDWENFKMPGAPYDGMGPLPPLEEFDPKMARHYVIPEDWFQFLYPRTGTTGLYTFFATVGTMLVSKEFYIITPDSWYTLTLIAVCVTIAKLAGPSIRNFFEEARTDLFKALENVKAEDVAGLQELVDNIKLEQWRAGAQKLINDAKQVNLAMMLETEYLNRQATVVETIKRQLDYQVAVQKVDTELAHGHMVNWIEKKVMKTITPESQKATLASCIAQLNTMASK
uniref:ATP synthase subunit b n=1 Tax=Phallusia mammillata TaxID=59560 RepID=A0A6F9D7E0_9ASCI|nr:ATP synthase F(0) complex subunit B1, mitochondrial-like [Phallusia mammillata]